MFISIKKHNRIVREIKLLHEQVYKTLSTELTNAKDLKSLIEKLTSPKTILTSGTGLTYMSIGGTWNPLDNDQSIELKVKENVATIVADELSDELIVKQMSNKVVFLGKDGEIIKKGYTKQPKDKGFNYKLIRE